MLFHDAMSRRITMKPKLDETSPFMKNFDGFAMALLLSTMIGGGT